MDTASLEKLVTGYIERYSKQYEPDEKGILRERDINFWAWEEFERLSHDAPEDAWAAILAVLEATDHEFTLSVLAAGPLEDLIDLHGPQVIERVERQARVDPKFRWLLQGVWEGSTPEIWARVVKAQEGATPYVPGEDQPG